MDLRQLSSYSFLPSIRVADNLINNFEREKNCDNLYAVLLVSKRKCEYMSDTFLSVIINMKL